MKLKGKQKKIDVAKPFGKITGEDFAKLREDKRSPFMGGGIAYAGGGRAMKRKMYSEGTPKSKSEIKKITSSDAYKKADYRGKTKMLGGKFFTRAEMEKKINKK
jgi:hypothetical protein